MNGGSTCNRDVRLRYALRMLNINVSVDESDYLLDRAAVLAWTVRWFRNKLHRSVIFPSVSSFVFCSSYMHVFYNYNYVTIARYNLGENLYLF